MVAVVVMVINYEALASIGTNGIANGPGCPLVSQC